MRFVLVSLITVLILISLSSLVSSFDVSIFEDRVFHGEPIVASLCDSSSSLSLECTSTPPFISNTVDNCTYYSFSTDDISCRSPLLSVENTSFRRKVSVLSPRDIVLRELDDMTSSDPVSTAKKIYAHSVLSNPDRVSYYLDSLKSSRDGELKCWPEGDCSIELTVEVLYFLNKADVNTSSRVYADALLWVESHQFPYKLEEWTAYFDADNETECRVYEDDSSKDSCIVSDDDSCSVEFDFSSGSTLNATCDDDYCVSIRDSFSQRVYDSCQDDDDHISISPHGGCFHYTDRPYICPSGLTEKVLMLDGLSPEVRRDAIKWLDDKIDEAAIAGNRLTTTPEVYANLYAYDSYDDPRLLSWILYSQNNVGSFGDEFHENTFYLTLEALEILESSSSSNEWYRDALDWVLDESYDHSISSLHEATLLYDFFIHQNFFFIQPGVVQSSSSSHNLSIASSSDLSVTFDNNVFDSELSRGLDYHNLSLSDPLWDEFGTHLDMLHISTNVFTRRYPVIFSNIPSVGASPSTHDIYDSSSTITVSVTPTHPLSCHVYGDSIVPSVVELEPSPSSVDVELHSIEEGRTSKTISYKCSVGNYSFTQNTTLDIIHRDRPPFSASQTPLSTGVTELSISNNFNQTITVGIVSNETSLSFSPRVTIAPLSTNAVNIRSSQHNLSYSVLSLSANNYESSVPVTFSAGGSTSLLSLLAIILLIVSVAVGVYVLYRSRQNTSSSSSPVEVEEELSEEIPVSPSEHKVSYSVESSEDDVDDEGTIEDDASIKSSFDGVSEDDRRVSRLLYALNKSLSSPSETLSDFPDNYSADQKEELFEDAKTFFSSDDGSSTDGDNTPLSSDNDSSDKKKSK